MHLATRRAIGNCGQEAGRAAASTTIAGSRSLNQKRLGAQLPQVEIDEKLYARLELEAQKQETSVLEVVARAIHVPRTKRE